MVCQLLSQLRGFERYGIFRQLSVQYSVAADAMNSLFAADVGLLCRKAVRKGMRPALRIARFIRSATDWEGDLDDIRQE